MASEGVEIRVTVRERFESSELKHATPLGTEREKAKAGTGVFVLVIGGLGRTPLEIEGAPEDLERLAVGGELFDRMRNRADAARRQQAAMATRRQRLERDAAEAARRREELDRLQAAAAQQAERERAAAADEAARRDELVRNAAAWEQAETIRRYVAHATAAGADPAWAAWALSVADGIDPLLAAGGGPGS